MMGKLTVTDMKRINAENDGVWFHPDTMKFHGTSIKGQPTVTGHFITYDSRWNGDNGFTVRKFDESTGSVSTVGELAVFNTIETAREYRNSIIHRTNAQ